MLKDSIQRKTDLGGLVNKIASGGSGRRLKTGGVWAGWKKKIQIVKTSKNDLTIIN